jgi:hypothetical protein
MRNFYELLDAFRAWYKESNPDTEPNPITAVMAASFAQHALAAYQDSLTPPTRKKTP